MSALFEELKWRGLVAATTDEAALRRHLDAGPVTVYCGFDPTAPSLHFGNLVQLVLLRHLQRAGHHVIAVVGGSTGLIGDPRPTAERVLRSKEQTAEWVASIAEQVRPFLDFAGDNPARVVNNLDWTAPVSALDFLRDIGKHFRVNQMIRKEAVAARLESLEGISYTEFSYQILQAFDFLELYRSYGCTLQTGGQDQWGNLTAGVDLIHRVEGVQAHAWTTPLLTDSAGEKLGKSAGNAVWLSAQLTSPYAFYQYWLNVEDQSVVTLLKTLTDLSRREILALEEAVAREPHRRAGQRRLALEVTTLVHGAAATAAAQAASDAVFGDGDLAVLDAATLDEATAQLPTAALPAGTSLVDALVATGLAPGRKAARRVVAEGGVRLNNARVGDSESALEESDFLHGRVALLRRGRRAQAAVRRRSDRPADES